MTLPRSRKVALGVAGGVVILALGAGAGALFAAPATPASLSAPEAQSVSPVSQREFADERPVGLDLAAGGVGTLSAPAAGRVTAWDCTPGKPLRSGTRPLSIDGTPRLTLATSVPLWRDLREGNSGADVRALETELKRLDLGATADGRLSAAEASAAAKLAGASTKNPVLALDRVIWLPAAELIPSTCDATLGATVSAGDRVASTPGGLKSARITALPADASKGKRSLSVGDVTVPVDAEGRVAAADLAALAAAPPVQMYIKDPNSGAVTGQWQLSEAATASVVPAGALYGSTGSQACVLTAAGARKVQVLGSELGQTFVSFAEGTPPDTVQARPKDAPSCQ